MCNSANGHAGRCNQQWTTTQLPPATIVPPEVAVELCRGAASVGLDTSAPCLGMADAMAELMDSTCMGEVDEALPAILAPPPSRPPSELTSELQHAHATSSHATLTRASPDVVGAFMAAAESPPLPERFGPLTPSPVACAGAGPTAHRPFRHIAAVALDSERARDKAISEVCTLAAAYASRAELAPCDLEQLAAGTASASQQVSALHQALAVLREALPPLPH
jgi:hypothetical protein